MSFRGSPGLISPDFSSKSVAISPYQSTAPLIAAGLTKFHRFFFAAV